MDIQCGMCGDPIMVLTEPVEGKICVPCQEYTMGYIYPVPVMAEGGE